jgi:DNA-binding Lrp family transcriptional regulator
MSERTPDISNSLRRNDPDQVRWVGARLSARFGHPNEISYRFLALPELSSKPTGDLASAAAFCWIAADSQERRPMIPFFVQIKCELGQAYAVADALARAEIASEIYSTAGSFDLLVKFYVDTGTDIGHFINEKVQVIPGIKDTYTIVTFKAF